jgi:3-oxoadipate enol-lactonase
MRVVIRWARSRSAAYHGPIMGSVAVALGAGWERSVDPQWLEGWTPRTFDLGDGTTEVVVMGDGPPLLLLPPLPGFKEAWVGVAWRLARRFRVITFDQRARFAGAPTWESLLTDLERVAGAFAPGPAVVIGHSLGGALAQRWALARAERVTALVLSSSFARVATSRGHWRARYLEQPLVLASQRWLPEPLAARIGLRLAARRRWVYDTHCDARILALLRCGMRSVPVRAGLRSVRLAFIHDTRADLPRIACPTLLVVGELERPWAHSATDELSRLIPGAEAKTSPDVAHLHPLSGSSWLAGAVGEWLGRLAVPGPASRVASDAPR